MKRFLLTIVFTVYTFFVPFVMVNCSSAQDEPYALDVNADTSDAAELEECQEMEFLVDECVDILQAENDRIETEHAQIITASELLADFTTCQAYESDSTSTTTSTSTATSTTTSTSTSTATDTDDDLSDCADTIDVVVTAYQICDSLSAADQYDECADVITSVEDTVTLCDDDSDDVTADFCALVTA